MADIKQILGQAKRLKKGDKIGKQLPGTQIKFGKNGSNYVRSPKL